MNISSRIHITNLKSFSIISFRFYIIWTWWVARISMRLVNGGNRAKRTNTKRQITEFFFLLIFFFFFFFKKKNKGRNKNCIGHKEKFVMSTIVDIECLVTYEKGVLWFLNSFSQLVCTILIICLYNAISRLYLSYISLQPSPVPALSLFCFFLLCAFYLNFSRCESCETIKFSSNVPSFHSLCVHCFWHLIRWIFQVKIVATKRKPKYRTARQRNGFQCHSTSGAKYHLITLLKFKQYIKMLTEYNKMYFHFKANVNGYKSVSVSDLNVPIRRSPHCQI